MQVDTCIFSTFLISGIVRAMSVYDDQGALDGLRRLDSQSIGAIYDQFFPEVYRYVRYRIDDDAAAEDIASDVFVRLLEAGFPVRAEADTGRIVLHSR